MLLHPDTATIIAREHHRERLDEAQRMSRASRATGTPRMSRTIRLQRTAGLALVRAGRRLQGITAEVLQDTGAGVAFPRSLQPTHLHPREGRVR